MHFSNEWRGQDVNCDNLGQFEIRRAQPGGHD